MKGLSNFLDADQKVKAWPSRPAFKRLVCAYLAGKFEEGVDYAEKDVNRILSDWHTFNDYFILRRSLVDYGMLRRTTNGSRYWKEKSTENADQSLS